MMIAFDAAASETSDSLIAPTPDSSSATAEEAFRVSLSFSPPTSALSPKETRWNTRVWPFTLAAAMAPFMPLTAYTVSPACTALETMPFFPARAGSLVKVATVPKLLPSREEEMEVGLVSIR